MKQIGGRARPNFMAQWRNTGALNAQIEETFTGHAIVKAFGQQARTEETFRETNDELYEAAFGAQFMSSLMQPTTMFLGNVQYLMVAVVGGLRVASGAISLGDVQAFIQYSRQFSMPLTQLASNMNVLQSGIASLERVFEFLDAEEQSADPADGALPTPVRGRVEFNDVAFSYDPDVPLIEHLSLLAEPGQTIAIVGPTGAGKTTLVNLIMRFYELDGGAITLDGHDIATLSRHELRSQIGMVLQDTWLFGGSIRDNIAYGKPGCTEDEVLAAAKATYVDRFVRTPARRLRHDHQRRGRQHQRRPEAAADHRPRLPRRPGHPHPRRGDELGRHPHRGPGAGGDERAARLAHELRDRPPPLDDPGRRPHRRDGARPHRRAGHPPRAARPRRAVLQPVQLAVRRARQWTNPSR